MTAEDDNAAMRVLAIIADPIDLERFDADRTWLATNAGLASLANGAVVAERLTPATEHCLQAKLQKCCWDVLHFVGHAQSRESARFASITLENSEGKYRSLTASYLSDILGSLDGLKAVILQACDAGAYCFEQVAQCLCGRGVPMVVTAPMMSDNSQQELVRTIYADLLAGGTAKSLRTSLSRAAALPETFQVYAREEEKVVVPDKLSAVSRVVPDKPVRRRVKVQQQAWQRELEAKRKQGAFDVFLCHHSADKPAVIELAQKLEALGILVWLDQWELKPGVFWRVEIEKQMSTIKSAAVFFGATGIGPWQDQEISVFLDECIARKVPVIPVLLSNAPLKPILPPFLRNLMWVDFRVSRPDPIKQMVWGITGRRPAGIDLDE